MNKKMIAIGILGLMFGTPAALAASAFILTMYCAQTVVCQNGTIESCKMYGGNVSDLMYLNGGTIQNNTRVLPFEMAMATNPYLGEASCSYGTQGNWPSNLLFFSIAGARMFPTNATTWLGASCLSSVAEDCPFSDTPTFKM